MGELATVLLAVLSSSVLSAAIAAIVAMRRLNREHEDDYFKWVVEKRRETYEMVDELIGAFRSSIRGEDDRFYHVAVSKDELADVVMQRMGVLAAYSTWMSPEMLDLCLGCMRVVTELREASRKDPEGGLEEAAKGRYFELACLRDRMGRQFGRDVARMHEVKPFLKELARRPTLFVEQGSRQAVASGGQAAASGEGGTESKRRAIRLAPMSSGGTRHDDSEPLRDTRHLSDEGGASVLTGTCG